MARVKAASEGSHQVYGVGTEALEMAQADEQWDIFKLAFLTTGRIAILSDQEGEQWMYDYRFLEAVR
jgi:hypothetical protein